MTPRLLDTAGWWLFVASALFFILASLRAGDLLGLAGSIFFMAANVAFLISHHRPGGPRED